MSLSKEENDRLSKALEDFQGLKDQFFGFDLYTRIQLVVSQMQFFQVVASVAIALSGILFSLKIIELNWWLVLSAAGSIFLLILASAYTRETIDSQDKDLKQVEGDFNKHQKTLYEKINETRQKGDFKIFQDYVAGEVDKKEKINKQIPQYTGEIVMFVFLMSIFLGITSVLVTEYHCVFEGVRSIIVFFFLVILAILLSVKNWSGALIKFISKRISEVLN